VRLLLFDIDGTLLRRATGEHRAALHAAIVDVHGIEIPQDTVTYAGRTDLEIARSILTRAEVDAAAIDDGQGAIREAACDHYARLVPESLRDCVAPAIPGCSTRSTADRRAAVTVTGNLEPIARLKLRRAGLLEHFPPGQGAYGSDGEDRAALPAIARTRAGSSERPFRAPTRS
jgi:beta-phosphoglucomutase-like phosphatase (HAD superfamily)